MVEVPKSPSPGFVALIMAGGSGTRFWPKSSKSFPKQYLNLVGDRSLIQQTVSRLKELSQINDIYICSGHSQEKILRKQLPEINGLILEPSARNTAPCLMLSAAILLSKGYSPNTVMGVFPADHYIGNETNFVKLLNTAIKAASDTDVLVTLGIEPTEAHTGYGYIEAEKSDQSLQVKKVKRFVEKPALEQAKSYLAQKTFYWNSGIFVWKLETICSAFETFLPEAWKLLRMAVDQNKVDEIYHQLPKTPIDTAIMEKAGNVRVLPAEMDWSDIGSWSALLELICRSEQKTNAILNSQTKLIDTEQCLVATTPHKKVALIGVKDLIVVETEDSLLISHRSYDQSVRIAAETFDV